MREEKGFTMLSFVFNLIKIYTVSWIPRMPPLWSTSSTPSLPSTASWLARMLSLSSPLTLSSLNCCSPTFFLLSFYNIRTPKKSLWSRWLDAEYNPSLLKSKYRKVKIKHGTLHFLEFNLNIRFVNSYSKPKIPKRKLNLRVRVPSSSSTDFLSQGLSREWWMPAGPEEGHRETADLAKFGPIRNSIGITQIYLIHFFWFVPSLRNLNVGNEEFW